LYTFFTALGIAFQSAKQTANINSNWPTVYSTEWAARGCTNQPTFRAAHTAADHSTELSTDFAAFLATDSRSIGDTICSTI
jgi:hypothetical protein